MSPVCCIDAGFKPNEECTKIGKVVNDRWPVHQIMQFGRSIFPSDKKIVPGLCGPDLSNTMTESRIVQSIALYGGHTHSIIEGSQQHGTAPEKRVCSFVVWNTNLHNHFQLQMTKNTSLFPKVIRVGHHEMGLQRRMYWSALCTAS